MQTPQVGDRFQSFVDTIAALRAPDGCPWDRAQTHTSIAKNMLEEAYEAVDAIEAGESAHISEELGDVLLQVVLQSQIAADEGTFTIEDVVSGIDRKLIRRHPHVFGEKDGASPEADTASEVHDIWERVKREERTEAGEDEEHSLLDQIPVGFPALMQAQKVSKKAVAAGFEWDSTEAVWEQVASEYEEFMEAEPGTPERSLEFGDMLFSLVNVARREGIDAESALRASITKFRSRWRAMEEAARRAGTTVEDLPTEELETLWQDAKRAGL